MNKEIDPKKMRYIEAKAREIATSLDSAINQPHPVTGDSMRKFGFGLLLFSFDGAELTWISNAERSDMIRLFEELLDKWKVGNMTDYEGGIDGRN